MKRTIFLFLTLSLFSSCAIVYFETPPPSGCRELDEIPSRLFGHYEDTASGFVLHVTETSFILFHEQNEDEIGVPSDSVVLKKYKDFYILSCGITEQGAVSSSVRTWCAFPLKFFGDSLHCYFLDATSSERELEAILGESLPADYLINPSKKEFKAMLNQNIFSLGGEFKRVE